MSDMTKAVFDVLNGDGPLTALLGTTEGAPSIFTSDVPGNAVFPYLVSIGEINQLPFDDKTQEGREVDRDIECYADADGDARTVEDIAEKVRALFHRKMMTIANFTNVITRVRGPHVNDGDGYYGRVVTVTFMLDKL